MRKLYRCLVLSFGLLFLLAGPAFAGPALVPLGPPEKVCQLTGEFDWQTGKPTAARTQTKAGLDAADLGFPVEHEGKLYLLFGDSWPSPNARDGTKEKQPDDAVGVTSRNVQPDPATCLDLVINAKPGGTTFEPASIVKPRNIPQGFFNVPSGGFSSGGFLYTFFWTDHCIRPADLLPSFEAPLALPQPSADCDERPRLNSIGTGILTHSGDGGRTFAKVAELPRGFVYGLAVNADGPPPGAFEPGPGIYVFGTPRYRASVPYLAYAAADKIENPESWVFYAGLGPAGQPNWVSYSQWQMSDAADEQWNAPAQAGVFVPQFVAGNCVGELSVTWNAPLLRWLALYNCGGAIVARVAQQPWGPWSDPAMLADKATIEPCTLMMASGGCGNRRDYWPQNHAGSKLVGGGLYAPYVLNRFTEPAPAGKGLRATTIYWLVSTWNPYQVVVMKSVLALPDK